ncbi:MAG TPA: molecular chaperone DnaJ [Candidatus Paceibacterota bacterium]|nr:molecular chaperone DnaJ [Candidatus Paceibacterota bacterium]
MAKDYYETLGVARGASKEEIKKAFHKLAHQHHPDKSGGDDTRFKEVNEAYQVLSDEKRRAEYDTYGRTFSGGGGPDMSGFGGFGGGQQGFDFEGVDLGDIFGDFFGGGFGGGPRVERGRDISIDIEISFEESMFGVERKVLLGKTSLCDTCAGSGAKPGTKMKKCATCNGKGKINEARKTFMGTFSTVRPCQTCKGAGEVPETACLTCKGMGIQKRQEEIAIPLPRGISDGEMVRMSGKGEAVARGIPGDLYIKIHVRPHATFRREGNNLVMDLDVKLSDALLGATYSITALDGTPIDVKIPEGVKYGDVLRLKGKGVPEHDRGRAGDVLIHVNIKTPAKLSGKVRKLIEELKREGV